MMTDDCLTIEPATADDFRDAIRQANDILRDQKERIVRLEAALMKIIDSRNDPSRMYDLAREALQETTP